MAEYSGRPDVLCAWVTEMKYRRWRSPEALAADFKGVDVSRVPKVTFHLSDARIETLFNFETGVVLLTEIECDVLQQSRKVRRGN